MSEPYWEPLGAAPSFGLWLPWTPVYTASAGTVVDNGDSRAVSRYRIAGKACEIHFARILTISATPGWVGASLPIPAAFVRNNFSGEAGNLAARCGTTDGLTDIIWVKYDGTAYPAGTTWHVACGSYEIA